MREMKVALQMYTVREEADRDYRGALERVATMGYRCVEIGWPTPFTAAEWQRTLKELNLQIVAAHVPLEQLETNTQNVADFHNAIGCTSLVCPFLPEARRKDREDYRQIARILNRVGMTCRDWGVQLHYHHHGFELQNLGRERGIDILVRRTDPAFVKFELDTYWIKHCGEDPVEFIRGFAGRSELLHLKDMTGDDRRTFAEVGEGILDFPAILDAAMRSEVKALVVEQDRCDRPPMDSAGISLRNLRALLGEGPSVS
jgi:sugar phosphate isomerase/epimerase